MKESTSTHLENLARLSRIEGQIKGVKRMIEEGEHCIDIITQIQAARGALHFVNKTIVEKHLRHCVSEALEHRDEQDLETKLAEIITTIKRLSK